MSLAPKYRLLSREELKDLREEFVQFLASQSIPASDWEKWKVDEPDKVDDLHRVFSDIVLDKVLLKVTLLEKRTRQELQLYRFKSNKVLLNGLRISDSPEIDLTQITNETNLVELFGQSPGKAQLFAAERQGRGGNQRQCRQI